MDWHKLQQTLFALDPTDPREDIAKLRAQAAGGANSKPVAPTIDYLTESAEVAEGSLKMDRDYSVADFAALAGVRIDEKQKMGPAGQLKAKDKLPTLSAGTTKNATRDKLVGSIENDDTSIEEGPWNDVKIGYQAVQPGGKWGPDVLNKKLGNLMTPKTEPSKHSKSTAQKLKSDTFLDKHKEKLERIASDPALRSQFEKFMNSIPEAKKPESPKQRNPVATYAQRSGAGVHKDQNKKNQLPRKEKHKGKVPMESIKDMLYRKLAEKK